MRRGIVVSGGQIGSGLKTTSCIDSNISMSQSVYQSHDITVFGAEDRLGSLFPKNVVGACVKVPSACVGCVGRWRRKSTPLESAWSDAILNIL